MTQARAVAAPIQTPSWVRDAVFYQIFPDRFASSPLVPKPGPLEAWDAPPTNHGFKGGDLLGIVDHLDDLANLGITALYLTPIFTSASNHRYHAYDYLTVDPLLGGTDALRTLLDEAHGRSMRVVLDGVFNHCGRGFWQFHHVAENGAQSPYRNWFHLDPEVVAGERLVDPYPDRGADGSASRPGYRAWWDHPALPKFNIDEPQVREYLLSVAEHWLRFGIDGWRLDVPAEIEDETFWQEFRTRCREINPDAYLVGEIWDEAPDWLRGDRFDALMNYPLGTAILGFAGGASLDLGVVEAHDTYRRMIRRLDGPTFGARVEHLMTAYDPAVVAVQLNLIGSHDAPRPLTILGRDTAAARQAMLIQLTLPGAPCIYYGDEIGLEGRNDPDNRRAYPAGPTSGNRALRAFVAALLAARRTHVALRRGTVRVIASADQAVAIHRVADGHQALVAINAGTSDVGLPLAEADMAAANALHALGVPDLAAGAVGPAGIGLPARGALVLVDD